MYSGTSVPGACGRCCRTAPADSRVPILLSSGFSISSFAQANDGELYVVDYSGGLYRIVFQPGAGGGTIPVSLAATGCVDSSNPTRPASGLIPYAVNAPFWSDGAVKDRWIALPNGQNITVGAQRRLGLPERHGAHEEFQSGSDARRNPSVHASHRRLLGRLQLSVERCADGCDSRTGWRDKTVGHASLALPERSQLPAMSHGRGRAQPWTRNRADEPRFHLSADQSHGKPDHDLEYDQYAYAGHRRRSGDVAGDP